MNSSAEKRWLLGQGVLLLLLAALLLFVFERSRLDLLVAGWAFDSAAGEFPLQHDWFFSDILHHGLKTLSYLFGIASIALCVYAWRHPLPWLSRRQALLAGLGVLLIPLLTTGLKQLTNRHCPWDIVDFGGYAPYLSLFELTSPDIKRGVCFPAGHASAGFVWMAWGLALRVSRPRWARLFLIGGLLMGSLMGLGRMLQGAHFLSHVFWSAWFAWTLMLILAAILRVPLLSRDDDPANEPVPATVSPQPLQD